MIGVSCWVLLNERSVITIVISKKVLRKLLFWFLFPCQSVNRLFTERTVSNFMYVEILGRLSKTFVVCQRASGSYVMDTLRGVTTPVRVSGGLQ